MSRQHLIAGLCLALLAALTVFGRPAQAAASDPASFMTDLGGRVLQLLTDKQRSASEREQGFAQLAEQSFDFPAIARFSLGSYWRTASDAEKQQYAAAFQAYMVQVYWSQFSGLNAADFKVTGQRDSGGGVTVVSSLIARPGTQPAKVDWTVEKSGDGYKISDVSIAGISQLLTYRDEFTSLLGRNNGSVSSLIDQLRQKTAS